MCMIWKQPPHFYKEKRILPEKEKSSGHTHHYHAIHNTARKKKQERKGSGHHLYHGCEVPTEGEEWMWLRVYMGTGRLGKVHGLWVLMRVSCSTARHAVVWELGGANAGWGVGMSAGMEYAQNFPKTPLLIQLETACR
jgi:hypothetical protein